MGLLAPPGAAPELCVLARDLPRARAWAEVFARRLGPDARVVTEAELTGAEEPRRVHRLRIGGEWPLAAFASGRGIPLAPGSFGGTTVLVVPAGTGADERDAWLALEEREALRQRSPFARLRVALADGDPSLARVLDELRGRARSVLVVPAEFCASPAEVQALAATLDASTRAGDPFDLAWLPGLGAELCTLAPEPLEGGPEIAD
jgi:hypothetical protein